jgi:GGDEF domain-containing protein
LGAGVPIRSTQHHAEEPESVQGSTSARLWLPYLPLLFAGIVGAHRILPSLDSGPVSLTAVILMITMLVRQFIVLADNRRLLLTVERQAFHDPLTGLANRARY